MTEQYPQSIDELSGNEVMKNKVIALADKYYARAGQAYEGFANDSFDSGMYDLMPWTPAMYQAEKDYFLFSQIASEIRGLLNE